MYLRISSFLTILMETMIFFQNFYLFMKVFEVNGQKTIKTTLPSMILPDFFWFNSNIKVDSKPVHFSFFWQKVELYYQSSNDNGTIKPWKDIKIEFHFKDTHKIYWLQIIDASPKMWKDIILQDKRNAKNLIIFWLHIVKNSQICSLNKLTSKKLHLAFVETNTVKETAFVSA